MCSFMCIHAEHFFLLFLLDLAPVQQKLIIADSDYFKIRYLLFYSDMCPSCLEEVLVPPHPPSLSGPSCASDTSVAFSSVQESTPLQGVTQAH